MLRNPENFTLMQNDDEEFLEMHPYITKFELVNIIGNRAVEISENKNLYLNLQDYIRDNVNMEDPLKIAEYEYNHNCFENYYIARSFPHQKFIIKKINSLKHK